MNFGDFKISIVSVRLTFIDVTILPVESPIFKGLFAALFPSSMVQKYKESDEFPASKITIEKVRVALRTRSMIGSCDSTDSSSNKAIHWVRQLWGVMIQRPIIWVQLIGVTLEVEKAYIAPPPPPELHSASQDHLPAAFPADVTNNDIPVFDQDYFLQFLREDEILDADDVTFKMERWRECFSM